MPRLFKVNTVNSDGTLAEKLIDFEVIDPSTSKPFVGEDGKPSVVITLRPISQEKHRAVIQEHTSRPFDKKTRQREELVDWQAVNDDLILYTVVDWKGIVGADDKPLECIADAKLELPGDVKNDVIARALQGESVDDKSASFRQSA